MPWETDLSDLSPEERAAVFRRRRLGVGAVAGALVLLIALAGRSILADDSSSARPRPDSQPETTLLGRPAGPCNAWPSSVRDQVSQLVMIGVDPANPAAVAQVLDENPTLGGLFVGGDDLAALNDPAFRNAVSATGAFVAIDDEGGRVQRIDAVAGDLRSPRRQAAEMSIEEITEAASARARAMRALGVNVDFAPVVDVTTQADDEVIGDRSYGADADTVVRNAGAFADGLRQGGVLPVLKHFPGHGRASGDSHDGAVTTPPLAELRAVDLVPYQKLVVTRPVAVMVGHLDVPGLTEPDTPASISPAVYSLLREVPFGGLTFTDDLAGMGAVTDRMSPAEAAEAAIAAGADVALMSSSLDAGPIVDRLVEAVQAKRLNPLRVNGAWLNVVEEKLALGLTTCDRLLGRQPS